MLIKDCFKMNFILAVVVVAFLVQQPTLLFIEATNTDLLSRIHPNTNRMQQSRTLSFLQHVDGFDSNSVCPSLLRSDVQVRLNSFKTIVSSCSDGFSECRLAMSPRGHIYGTTNPEFNSTFRFNITRYSTNEILNSNMFFCFYSIFKPY